MNPTFVYFIKPKGRKGPIKIGCSNAPADRLMALGAIPNTKPREQSNVLQMPFSKSANVKPPPRSLIQWLQGCWSAIRIFTARKCVNTSTRLIFFARWLAPELWEGQQ